MRSHNLRLFVSNFERPIEFLRVIVFVLRQCWNLPDTTAQVLRGPFSRFTVHNMLDYVHSCKIFVSTPKTHKSLLEYALRTVISSTQDHIWSFLSFKFNLSSYILFLLFLDSYNITSFPSVVINGFARNVHVALERG